MSGYVTTDGGPKRMRLLEPQGEPDIIECDGREYVRRPTMASEPRKVSQVMPPVHVDFDTGDLMLEVPEYDCSDHDIELVSVRLHDARWFEPYSARQRFRVTIEEVPDGE